MECFNCGKDPDMEIFVMINGKMKKISICSSCYNEQMNSMVQGILDSEGNIDTHAIQKQMFEFFQSNREEFEKLFNESIDDPNFDMKNLKPENFDIKDMNFSNSGFNLKNQDINEIFRDFVPKFKKDLDEDISNLEFKNNRKDLKFKSETEYEDKELRVLENALRHKRLELQDQIKVEDYFSAANLRDEIRDINRKIMHIKKLTKEGDK